MPSSPCDPSGGALQEKTKRTARPAVHAKATVQSVASAVDALLLLPTLFPLPRPRPVPSDLGLAALALLLAAAILAVRSALGLSRRDWLDDRDGHKPGLIIQGAGPVWSRSAPLAFQKTREKVAGEGRRNWKAEGGSAGRGAGGLLRPACVGENCAIPKSASRCADGRIP
jgi:hypothetical protein